MSKTAEVASEHRSCYVMRHDSNDGEVVIEAPFNRMDFSLYLGKIDSRAGGYVEYFDEKGKSVLRHPRVKDGLF